MLSAARDMPVAMLRQVDLDGHQWAKLVGNAAPLGVLAIKLALCVCWEATSSYLQRLKDIGPHSPFFSLASVRMLPSPPRLTSERENADGAHGISRGLEPIRRNSYAGTDCVIRVVTSQSFDPALGDIREQNWPKRFLAFGLLATSTRLTVD